MAYTTINNGKLYFNTVLYTGNGSNNHTISGVGFQSDLTWLKSRSSAISHMWVDAVRGVNTVINSNTTDVESTFNCLDPWNADGFVLSDNTNFNGNGVTFAAWNWLAAGTAPSNTYAVKVVSDGGNKYRFDDFGTSAVTLEISEGGTFTFDQSDASNSGHPIRFSTTSDGTHNSGTEYTTGVTTNGTPGSAGAYTRITVAASAPTLYYYCSSHSGMGGQANTPVTNSFSSFNGTIQSNISPNTTSGFSVVSYTGNSTSGATVGHGLGAIPKWIIVKALNTTDNWEVYHASLGAEKYIELNLTAAQGDSTAIWNDTEPTSSVFSIGNNGGVNTNGNPYIAYCFAEKQGYSKFGSYTGNGNANGTFIYTGFKPAMIIFKQTNTAGGQWYIYDNKRGQNELDEHLYPNLSSAEATGDNAIDILSNGFKMRSSNGDSNASGSTYIYMCFAENPFTSSTGTPVTAR